MIYVFEVNSLLYLGGRNTTQRCAPVLFFPISHSIYHVGSLKSAMGPFTPQKQVMLQNHGSGLWKTGGWYMSFRDHHSFRGRVGGQPRKEVGLAVAAQRHPVAGPEMGGLAD